ncbi:MAG: nuclear transport factor 2 family protein [candidate division WOR-3 bacterium]
MRQLAGLLLVILAGCWFGVARQPAADGALGSGLSVVREFADRFGTKRVNAVVGLFSDDAIVEIRGLGAVIQGRSGLRDLAEYAFTVKSRLRMTSSKVSADTVWADLVETNDWLRFAGMEELRYRAVFRTRLGRIEEAVLELEPESRDAVKQQMMDVLIPLLNEEPETLERLMPGGRLVFNRTAGSELMRILRTRAQRQ